MAIRCDEEGSFFPEPRNLTVVISEDAMCLACRGFPLSSFVPASDVAVRANGFTRADYE